MLGPLTLAAILFVLWLPCLAGGVFGWRKLRKKYPEISEFQHLGVTSIFTGGLPLLGLYPHLFVQSWNIPKASFLSKWLTRPMIIWAICMFVDIVVRVFAPHRISSAFSHYFTHCFAGIFLYMLIIGWNAPDELIRLSSRKTLNGVLWGILLLGCFFAVSSGSLWSVVGFLLLWPSLFFLSSTFVQNGLLTLTVGTRHSTTPRARMWMPLLFWGAACLLAGFGAPWLHRMLAHLVA